MTCGERIAALRKEKGYPQEYLAQQIGVSRQAVHKWEKDLSSPDTANLIALAQVLNTTVDYIVNGELSSADKKNKKKLPAVWTYILTVVITAILTFLGTILFIANRPVSFDAGVCGGGFSTAVFDRYAASLISDNIKRISGGNDISAISPVRGSHNVSWEGKAIYMSFDADITFSDGQTAKIPLRFMGERKWIEAYDWRIISDCNLSEIYKKTALMNGL